MFEATALWLVGNAFDTIFTMIGVLWFEQRELNPIAVRLGWPLMMFVKVVGSVFFPFVALGMTYYISRWHRIIWDFDRNVRNLIMLGVVAVWLVTIWNAAQILIEII
jgi:hypothetical protein